MKIPRSFFYILIMTALSIGCLSGISGCKSKTGDGNGASGNGGSDGNGGTDDNCRSGGDGGSGRGSGGSNCSDFPNISGIDCSAFPKDPGDTYSVSGTTYYVSTSGNDSQSGSQSQPFGTISRALENSQSGDAIIVKGGTYQEGASGEFDYYSLVLNKSNVLLRAVAGESVTVKPASSAVTYGMMIGKDNIIVDGINLSGYSSALVSIESGIKNIILKNMTVRGSGQDFIDGIVAPNDGGMDGLLLKNIRVENIDLGISCSVGPCRHWRLDKVTVIGKGSGDDTGADAIAAEVRNENAPESEISSNWLITNVEVSGASGDGIDIKALGVAVYNANVHDNARNGVKFWRGGDLVNSFVVNHDADAAVVFERAGTYRILNSLIAYENFGCDTSYTMTVGHDLPSDAIELSLINTVFYNNSSSIFLSPSTTATIQNCLLGNTDTDQIIVKESVEISESDPVSSLSNLAIASGNLPFTTDPLFSNPPGDFSFPESSPLTDAGTTATQLPSFDYQGSPRNAGNAPDIGPLELF